MLNVNVEVFGRAHRLFSATTAPFYILSNVCQAPMSASVLTVLMPGQQEHGERLLPSGPGHDLVAGECTPTPPAPPFRVWGMRDAPGRH